MLPLESGAAEAASSPLFWGAVVLTGVLTLDAASKLRELRFVFASLVYLTTALWYFVDPVYQPEEYLKFSSSEFDDAYLQIILFLLAFRALTSVVVPRTPTRVLGDFDPRQLDRGPVVGVLFFAWLLLFLGGMAWANFDVLGVMFPVNARAGGNVLFARGRYGGTTGSLLAAAAYSYLVVCSCFGVMLVCTRRTAIRVGMLALIAWTWPMFFLSGTRNGVLAVTLPAILATLLLRPWSMLQKFLFIAGCGLTLNVMMLAAIEFRNDGLDKVFSSSDSMQRIAEAKHRGLGMPEEMIYILRYQRLGAFPAELGMNYVEHALNFIPRAIWPDKPMPGRQFAQLRVGLALDNDVTATVSYGFIGQGVANFGPYIGPIAPALLLALMSRFLCRLPNRGDRFVRACFILFCLGLTPNLGRDISLFVLWPAIFGYLAVRLYEWRFVPSGRRGSPRRPSLAGSVRPSSASLASGSLSTGTRPSR